MPTLSNKQYAPPTESEFEALPPALKRKCFSTLERLRYAEAQAQSNIKLNNSISTERPLSRRFITTLSISKLRESITPLKLQRPKSFGQQLPPGTAYTLATVTQEDALWFSRLPDKVKRGYFSIEEEKLLLSQRENSLTISTPSVYKLRPLCNRSLPSLQTHSSDISSLDDSTAYSSSSNSDTDDDDAEMDSDLIDSFKWVDNDLDLTLDDYHHALVESRTSSVYSHRSSITSHRSRAGTVGTPVSYQEDIVKTSPRKRIEQRGTGWAPDPMPAVPQAPATAIAQQLHSRKASMVSITPRKTSSSSSDSVEVRPNLSIISVTAIPPVPPLPVLPAPSPSPTSETSTADMKPSYYLDPAARLKLRAYLASASKFDEAVEFGFPSLSTSEKPEIASERPTTSHAKAAQRPFGNRAKSSTLYGTSTTISAGTLIPKPPRSRPVPSTSEFYAIPYQSVLVASQPPEERNVDFQAQLRKLDRDPLGCGLDREMTIRMTLTRSDLRADESLIYPQSRISNVGKERPSTSFGRDDPFRVDAMKGNLPALPFKPFNQKKLSFKNLWTRR